MKKALPCLFSLIGPLAVISLYMISHKPFKQGRRDTPELTLLNKNQVHKSTWRIKKIQISKSHIRLLNQFDYPKLLYCHVKTYHPLSYHPSSHSSILLPHNSSLLTIRHDYRHCSLVSMVRTTVERSRERRTILH